MVCACRWGESWEGGGVEAVMRKGIATGFIRGRGL
jgi:hypothetical protein